MDIRAQQLTPDEDSELRRLHVFRMFGAVAQSVAQRYEELRSRDRRTEVREPTTDSLIGTRR